jgi:1-acyl-sn-glycerol-3-phosphate acyltransferase
VSFVAKAEIGNWPLFGFLADRGGTIYHKRGCHDSASGVVGQVLEHLADARRVGVFPEGGVLPGSHVHHFHARMFKVAQEANCPIQPAMVRYLRDGRRDDDAGFRDGEPFLPNLVRMMGRRSVLADLQFLEPFAPEDLPRKQLAARAEAAVRDAYEAPVAVDGEPSIA